MLALPRFLREQQRPLTASGFFSDFKKGISTALGHEAGLWVPKGARGQSCTRGPSSAPPLTCMGGALPTRRHI